MPRYVGIDGVCWDRRGMLGLTGYVGIHGVCWDCRGMLELTGYVGIDGNVAYPTPMHLPELRS
eukprot:12431466-Karenia_brevis.AAC.1